MTDKRRAHFERKYAEAAARLRTYNEEHTKPDEPERGRRLHEEFAERVRRRDAAFHVYASIATLAMVAMACVWIWVASPFCFERSRRAEDKAECVTMCMTNATE